MNTYSLNASEKMALEKLRRVKHNSIWGIAIRNVCDSNDAEKFKQLLRELKSQACDEIQTMRNILGQGTLQIIMEC